MNAYLETLVEHGKQYALIETGRLETGLSPEEVTSEIGARAGRLFDLCQENDVLLRVHIFPVLEAYADITPDIENELFETAQTLSSFLKQSDSGLALLIYEALCKKARLDGDTDRLIKYLYWRGITMFYINRGALGEAMLKIFGEAASYASDYENLGNRDTRMYINRCLGNVYIVSRAIGRHEEADRHEDSALVFWTGLTSRGVDPDFPWTTYLLNLYKSRYSRMVSEYRTNPSRLPGPEIMASILETSGRIEAMLENGKAEGLPPFGGARYEYPLMEALYLTKQMGYGEFTGRLREMIYSIEPGDYSYNGTYVKLNLGAFYLNYLTNGWDDSPEKSAHIKAFIEEIFDYCSAIPIENSSPMLVNLLSLFGRAGANYMDPWHYLLLLLRITTYRHIPTFAHSLMVSLITGRLFRAMAETEPEALVGLCGLKSADGLHKKFDELFFMARVAGLCHDVGKIDYINTISLYARSLTDTEFEVIRKHPSTGRSLILPHDSYGLSYARSMECFACVAEGHHRWYDGTGGYPAGFDIVGSPYRTLIGIVSAADSIDAATDNIGRGYARGISLEAVCAEIIDGAGTRYDPAVARLLENRGLVSELGDMINGKRRKAYYKAYLQSGAGSQYRSMEEVMEI